MDKTKEAVERLRALGDHTFCTFDVAEAFMGDDWGGAGEYVDEFRDTLIDLLEYVDPDDWADEVLAEHGLMRLPVDADGAPIHVGDVMVLYGAERAVMAVDETHAWFDVDKYGIRAIPHRASEMRHHHEPTVDEVLRELVDVAIGDIADKARKKNMSYQEWVKSNEVIAEYAEKMRLADE